MGMFCRLDTTPFRPKAISAQSGYEARLSPACSVPELV